MADYQARVPLGTWETFWNDWWGPGFPVLGGRTWPGPIRYLAKTSGTTGAASKHIPVSPAMMRANRAAALDVLAWHFAARPGSRVLAGQNVLLGGTTTLDVLAPGIRAGDLSGIVAADQPVWARGRVLPPPDIARLTDWRDKMARLAGLALERPVASMSGTASWLLLFFETASALRGGARLAEMFPRLELLVHGGVGFAPYRERFAHWMQGGRAQTREVYAASEGFCALADRGDGEGLRLVLDRGLFFEFVRPDHLDSASPDRRWIGNAEPGVDYALVLSSNAGLWSYVIGDTVRLVSTQPPRVLITGRTGWMLSVAGEHVSAGELDLAMAEAAAALGRRLADYAAAPLQPDAAEPRGGHLYVVELDGPAAPDALGRGVDAALLRMNDDYAAHRAGGFGLRDPRVVLLPPGSFARWMEQRGRLGGQNKVPRIVRDAAALDGLLAMAPPHTGGRPPSPPGSGAG